MRSSLLSSSPPRCFSVNDQRKLPRGRQQPGVNLTDHAPTEVDNQRQVTISVVPQGPLIRVDGEIVPSTWRWTMECGYCDHVEEVSMPHIRNRLCTNQIEFLLPLDEEFAIAFESLERFT